MTTTIVHISDLHLRKDWHEEQGVVLREFFEDLKVQIKDITDVFTIFTGDILQEGTDREGYQYFNSTFGEKLYDLGITRERLIVVPGNHDIDREYTKTNYSLLRALQERKTLETTFNETVYGEHSKLLKPKFLPFLEWQESISDRSLTDASFCGRGFELSDDIGIYCLNTALYSFGGLKDEYQNTISDYQVLPVETRRLHAWLDESSHKYKILVMHHPIEWLAGWAEKELNSLCLRYFSLVLTGHNHNKELSHVHNGVDSFVRCSAPQLFSRKIDMLGYSILQIDDEMNGLNICYRQWAQDRFVAGTSFSKNDTGIVRLSHIQTVDVPPTVEKDTSVYNRISTLLKNNLEKCLKCYASLPAVWVLPNIADQSEFSSDDKSAVVVTADVLRGPFRDCFVIAPRQFGLSSLGRYLSLGAWESEPGRYAMYIDSNELQNHETAIEKYIQDRIDELGLSLDNLSAIILDDVFPINSRKINNIKKSYPNIPLTILLGMSDREIGAWQGEGELTTKFELFFLWSLERTQMRELIQKFVAAGYDLNEDAALQRLVEDIENLNVHRTPLVCLTLLAVYASGIDYSPVNRTDMFERFLFLIFFSYKKLPDYSNFPDMKDALAVIGAFCESVIRQQRNGFSKSEFILYSTKFCARMSIDVDCSKLFEVMSCEKIIVKAGEMYCFRYVHWIYFFGAHRMHHDANFCKFVLKDSYYMNFPEIVEFYSGVDRRREELLGILTTDLRSVNNQFESRTGIDAGFDPYSAARWTPDKRAIEELRSHLKEEAARSSLPVALKDQIADGAYDRTVPYDQQLRTFVKDASLFECMQILRAAARALRNSDYVRSEVKAELLSEILRAWTKELQVLFILSPLMAEERFAVFDHIKFFLGSSFDEFDGDELWKRIVDAIPRTVVAEHDRDIASPRMTPLFERSLSSGGCGPADFLLVAVIVKSRPSKWQELIDSYIRRLPKNSFYLLKTYEMLRNEYRYGFVSPKTKSAIYDLISLTVAKHETGAKSPNKKLVDRVKSSIRGSLNDSEPE